MKLLDLYKMIGDTANWTVSSEGLLSQRILGQADTQPLLVKKLRLAFPTEQVLKDQALRDVMIFHPLKEDVLKPDTDVIDVLRSSINTRLNLTTCWVMLNLLIIAGSSEEHAKLDPDQSAFLSKVKNASEDCLEDLKKILASMQLDAKSKTAVSIFTKKGGMKDGQKFTFLGVVKFPMYQALVDSIENTAKTAKPEVFGVKLSSKKSRDTLISLFEYIFPEIANPMAYSYGSSSLIAALLDSLMQTTARIAAPINQVIELFRNMFSDPDEMIIPGDWMPTFLDLGSMMNEIRMVPTQTANALEMPEDVKAKVGLVTPTATPFGAPAAAPYIAPKPAPTHTAKGLDFAAMVRGGAQAAQPVRAGFGFGTTQPQVFGQAANTHPAFGALAPVVQQQSHPFQAFQSNNAQSNRGGFGFGGNQQTTFGGGLSGGNRGF